ncbi:hypothetical protein [Kocuria sp. UBA5001]|nr:hypothetical protein [Kocuria sp. UBA5001]
MRTKRSSSSTTSYNVLGFFLGYVLRGVLGQLLFQSLGLPFSRSC